MIYLGTLGRMIGIKCPASQNVETEERYTFETTLEGRRKAQAKQATRRSWALRTTDATTPAETAVLTQFAQGAWGPGPFQFVPADAPHTNLMTPDGSLCLEQQRVEGVFRGGPVDLGLDGWSAQSLVASDPQVQTELYGSFAYTPVLSGVPVTGSAWISAASSSQAYVRLYWRDSAGVILGTSASRGVSAAEGLTRVSVTAVPPAGAVAVQIVSLWAARLTRPALTWTRELHPWGSGQGCSKAVVSSMSSDLVLAVPGHTYSNVSFTVTEVG